MTLCGEGLTAREGGRVWSGEPTGELAPESTVRRTAGRAVLDGALSEGRPIYGVTRGLGTRVGATLGAASVHEFSRLTVLGRAKQKWQVCMPDTGLSLGLGNPLSYAWLPGTELRYHRPASGDGPIPPLATGPPPAEARPRFLV